jgi:hypothetical protein
MACGDGRPYGVLINMDATLAEAQALLLRHGRSLVQDGLLTVGFSGHGTLRDRKVDVARLGPKEGGLCFADKVWWASEIAAWVRANLPQIRIEYIADCCHAENNWRAFGEAVTFGYVDNPKGPVIVRLDPPAGWPGQMIQFGGCRQLAYSYGTATGGTWSGVLNYQNVKTPRASRLAFYAAAEAIMPAEQKPVWTEYNASQAFRNGEVFQ